MAITICNIKIGREIESFPIESHIRCISDACGVKGSELVRRAMISDLWLTILINDL